MPDRSNIRACILPKRSIIAIGGAERFAFLHRLVPCVITQETTQAWGCLLTPQGKILADFIVAQSPDRNALWLDCHESQMMTIGKTLSSYKLHADISLQPLPSLAVAAMWQNPHENQPHAMSIQDPRSQSMGWRTYADKSKIDAPIATPFPFSEYEQMRIAHCVPDGVCDFIANKSLLLEFGFDAAGAIDWQKGCYIGQELTARTRYRGLLKRKFAALICTNGDAQIGDIANVEGKAVATISSAHANKALGMVRMTNGELPQCVMVCDNGRTYQIA